MNNKICTCRRIVRQLFDQFRDLDVPVTNLKLPNGSHEKVCLVAPLADTNFWLVYMIGTYFSPEFRRLTVISGDFSHQPWDCYVDGYQEYFSLRSRIEYSSNDGRGIEKIKHSVAMDPTQDTKGRINSMSLHMHEKLKAMGHIQGDASVSKIKHTVSKEVQEPVLV